MISRTKIIIMFIDAPDRTAKLHPAESACEIKKIIKLRMSPRVFNNHIDILQLYITTNLHFDFHVFSAQ